MNTSRSQGVQINGVPLYCFLPVSSTNSCLLHCYFCGWCHVLGLLGGAALLKCQWGCHIGCLEYYIRKSKVLVQVSLVSPCLLGGPECLRWVGVSDIGVVSKADYTYNNMCILACTGFLLWSWTAYRILQIVHGGKLSHFSWFLWQLQNFYSEIFFNKGYKMALYNFKACKKDACDMPLPSPSGSLMIVQSLRRLSKLITSADGNRSYTSSESYHCKVCSKTFDSNCSSVISAFSKAMMPVTIHTRTHACLRVVWRCPYILGYSSAETI